MRTLLVSALVLAATPALAGDGGVSAKMKLSFAGLPVGRFSYDLSRGSDAYAIEGSMRTTGAASVFARTSGTVSSRGTIRGDRLVPTRHDMQYRSGKEDGSLTLTFKRGTVANSRAVPEVKYRKGAVKPTPAQMRDAIDPVTGLVIAATPDASLATVCTRRMPVFDGKNRYDLALAPKRSEKRETKGFSGTVHVCSVRYRPVAGHRPNRETIERVAANRAIEIAFAPAGDTGLWSLYAFAMPTRYGPASGRVTSFRVR